MQRRQAWTAAGFAALLMASPAWAQQRSSPPADLGEIVITADRETESLANAALPVGVVEPETLVDAGATRPTDLTHLAPGLQVGGLSGSFTAYYIRGIGNFTGNSLQDPAVTFNFDGVTIGRPSSTTGFFYDLERIEVLRGPQGALYGRNATGGAINVLPRRPELGVLGGELSAEGGEHSWLRVDGAVNLPVGDAAAVRAAASRVAHDDFMNGGGDDQDDWAGRLSFLLEPAPEVAIAVAADYFHQGGRGTMGAPIALGPDNRFGVTSPEGAGFYQTQRVAIAGRNFNPIPANQRLDNEFWGLTANVEWEIGAGTLTLAPAYREGRLDTVASATGLTLSTLEHDRQASLEARYASDPSRRVSYLVGVLLFEEENDVPLFVPNNQYNMSIQRLNSRLDSTALYGRVSVDATERLRATLGARHTADEKEFSGHFESFNRLCPPVPTGSCPNAPRFPADLLTPPLIIPPGAPAAAPVFNPLDGTLTVGFAVDADEEESFSHTTWRAALEWDLAERSLLYASYETGYKSGGFFFSNDDMTYRPEFVDAFTLGWRNRFYDNRLRFDVEAFRWAYEDQQVNHITLDSLGVQNLRTSNVGQATIQGVQIEAEWLAPSGLLLSGDLQILDAVYDDFRYVTPLSAGPPVTGCLRTAGPGGFTVDCSGKRPPYAPEWTLNLAAERSFALASGAALIARVRAHYQTEMLTGLDFTPHEYQDDYWQFDASLTWRAPDDRLFASLFARNLTDETVVGNTFQPPLGSFVVGTLRPPRIVGLRVGARF